MMRISLVYFGILLMAGCAQQRNPTGGPRDTTAPKVLMADPLPMSTGFDSQSIEILFDEFVQLKGVKDQVLISPPLEFEPEITLKGGKRLIIDLGENQLSPNTTYTINLGEAISDNNEGNILEENVYLFSTGAFIDSLELRGQLLKARFNDPCADCMAFLFPDVEDSLIIGQRPLYVAKADGSGFFVLSNLSSGSYRLMALDDTDSDLRIGENESLGFLLDLVQPMTRDSVGLVLRLSKAEKAEPEITFSEWSLDGTYLSMSFKGADSLGDIQGSASDMISFIEKLNEQDDSLRIWFREPLAEDSELIFDLGMEKDTLVIGRVSEREVDYDLQSAATLADQEAEMVIQFSSPIAIFDSSRVELKRDSVPLDYIISSALPALSLSIDRDWEPGNYSLTLFPGALRDIYGVENDTISLSVKCASKESFGFLSLNLDLPDSSSYLLQLLDSKREVIRTSNTESDTTWTLDYLNAGAYTLRVFIDVDGDGSWTGADFNTRRLPEPVFVLPEPITVRANWELEQDIIVEFKP